MRSGVLGMLLVTACGGSAPTSIRPTPPAAQARIATPAPPPGAQPATPIADSVAAHPECDALEPMSVAAFEADRSACFARVPDACARVAAEYACGRGTARDVRLAFEYGGAACRLESAPGCRIAAAVAGAPDGGRLDATRAYGYALHGCIQGDDEACTYMARALAAGRGVTADPAEAAQLFDGLCHNHGVAAACESFDALPEPAQARDAEPAGDGDTASP